MLVGRRAGGWVETARVPGVRGRAARGGGTAHLRGRNRRPMRPGLPMAATGTGPRTHIWSCCSRHPPRPRPFELAPTTRTSHGYGTVAGQAALQGTLPLPLQPLRIALTHTTCRSAAIGPHVPCRSHRATPATVQRSLCSPGPPALLPALCARLPAPATQAPTSPQTHVRRGEAAPAAVPPQSPPPALHVPEAPRAPPPPRIIAAMRRPPAHVRT